MNPTLTRVNNLRIVFDETFAINLGLLEAITYYSANRGRYQFEVTENSWGADREGSH